MHLFVSPLASLFTVINVLSLSLPLGTGKFLVFSCPLTSQGSLILVTFIFLNPMLFQMFWRSSCKCIYLLFKISFKTRLCHYVYKIVSCRAKITITRWQVVALCFLCSAQSLIPSLLPAWHLRYLASKIMYQVIYSFWGCKCCHYCGILI